MTIRKGESWGVAAAAPDTAVKTTTDREISLALESARRAGEPFPEFVVGGGDLGRTLAVRDVPAQRFPLDVGEVLVDGRHHYFVAHAVARTRNWRRFAVAMNAQWLGAWNLGPKAHPNDGIVDAYEAALGFFEWRKIRARLALGAHLPHPQITQTRSKAVTLALAKPLPVYLDGERVGDGQNLAVRVIPDAITVYA